MGSTRRGLQVDRISNFEFRALWSPDQPAEIDIRNPKHAGGRVWRVQAAPSRPGLAPRCTSVAFGGKIPRKSVLLQGLICARL